MQFRNRDTGLLIDEAGLRKLYPNVSFPLNLTTDIIDQFGYDPVFDGPQPTVKPPYETLEAAEPTKISGKWYTNYVVGPVFKEYTDEQGILHTVTEQYQEHCSKIDSAQAQAVRQARNLLLSESDWTQLLDSPFNDEKKNEWILYRQSLRQVPEQPNFPWDIEWPATPNKD